MKRQTDPFDKYDEYRLHMETLLSAPLIDFDIPIRMLIALDNVGIRRLRDLVALTRKQLFKINRINVVSVRFLEDFLARQGLSLKK